MPSDNILHNDIRMFKSDAKGPLVETTNTAIKFPSLDRRTVPGKAPLAHNISIHLHEFLKDRGVGTHFAERAGKNEQAVFETEQLAFDVVVRNIAAGDLVNDFGLEEGYRFLEPLVEYFVRPENLDKKPVRVSESHLTAFDLIDPEGLNMIIDQVHRINDLLTGVFFGIGVELVDIRLEFGVHQFDEDDDPVIMLSSELSPDTMTIWDIESQKSLDMSYAFQDEGDGLTGIKEITRRLRLDSAKAAIKRQA